jgi:hypothetical protein
MGKMNKEDIKHSADIDWHHGTCDLCGTKFILILMLGYDKSINHYCICKNCLSDNISYIIYGSHNYKDGLAD